MRGTQNADTDSTERANSSHRATADATDEFPDIDREYDDVTTLADQIRTARDEYQPPDTPSYNPDADAQPGYKTGYLRTITRQRGQSRDDSETLRLGLDTADANELQWVEVTDTGEYARSNEYVRFCKHYGVHPECPQDLYNVEVAYRPATGEPFIPPTLIPGLHHVWTYWWVSHFRLGLWNDEPKKDIWTGKVPTRRFFPVYLALGTGLILVNHLLRQWAPLAESTVGLAVSVAFFVHVVIFVWAAYAKLWYHTRPYLCDWLSWVADRWNHRV